MVFAYFQPCYLYGFWEKGEKTQDPRRLSDDILKKLGIDYYAGYVSKMHPGTIIYGVEVLPGSTVLEQDKLKIHAAAEYIEKEFGLKLDVGYNTGMFGDFEEPLNYQFSADEIPY
jgi:hypothetical protein